MKTPVSIQGILDAANSSGRHVAGLRGDFRSRLNAFRRHRSARGTAGTDGGFSPCACGLGHCRRGYSRRHLGLAPASAGVRRSDAGLPHYGGMVAQSAFLPVIGLRCTALSARHGHDALAHFHFTKPPLYAAVPLVVAVPQAPVAGGLCLSQPSTLYIEEQSS